MEVPPAPLRDACWLCATELPDIAVEPGAERCPACGLYQEREIAPPARVRIVAGLLVVYAASAALLALTQ